MRDREDLQRETFEKWRLLEELRGIRESLRTQAIEERATQTQEEAEEQEQGAQIPFLSLLGNLPASLPLSPRWEVVNRDDKKGRSVGGATNGLVVGRNGRKGGRTTAQKEDENGSAAAGGPKENTRHTRHNDLTSEADACRRAQQYDTELLTARGEGKDDCGQGSPLDVEEAAEDGEQDMKRAAAGRARPVVAAKQEVAAADARAEGVTKGGAGVTFFSDETFAELLEDTRHLRTMLGIAHDDVQGDEHAKGVLREVGSDGDSVELTSLRLTI